jgi:phage tail protein X
MTVLQYQNPTSVDAVLDSFLISAGPPEVRREVLVIGDSSGAVVGLVSGRVPVDGSGITQPVSLSGNVTVIQSTAASLNATVVFGSPQHVIVDSAVLGTVTVAGSVSVIGTSTVDVTDRAARLVGVVYGSQGQQIKQTATNFNLQVELATGGTLYDARQIRALTSADVVMANQGGAPWSVTLPAGQAVELLDSGGTNKASISALGAIKVDGSAVTQPVSIAATVSENLAQLNAIALGSPSAYGTSPGAVNVLGVNAFITNTPAVTLASTTITGTVTVSGTVTANQGGAPWSVTFPSAQAVTLTSTTITGTVAVTQSTSPWVENISQFGGNPIVTGIGISGVGIPRVTVSSDSFPITQAVTQSTSPWRDQLVDESGNFVQFSEERNLYQAIFMELRAIRLGIQSMATEVDGNLIELAQEYDEDQSI